MAQVATVHVKENGSPVPKFESEGRATGIPKIMEAMVNNGSPVAEFEFDEDRSYFMVRLPVHPAALEVAEISGGDESRSESPTQSPTQADGSLVRLLFALKDEEYSSGSLRQILGIKHRPTFRDNYLHPALQQGLIEYTIPDKPQSSKQCYRLTDKGRKLLASLEGAE